MKIKMPKQPERSKTLYCLEQAINLILEFAYHYDPENPSQKYCDELSSLFDELTKTFQGYPPCKANLTQPWTGPVYSFLRMIGEALLNGAFVSSEWEKPQDDICTLQAILNPECVLMIGFSAGAFNGDIEAQNESQR